MVIKLQNQESSTEYQKQKRQVLNSKHDRITVLVREDIGKMIRVLARRENKTIGKVVSEVLERYFAL